VTDHQALAYTHTFLTVCVPSGCSIMVMPSGKVDRCSSRWLDCVRPVWVLDHGDAVRKGGPLLLTVA
jgi:hypothetical protein